MIGWLDWKGRFYSQELLNWSGQKFGMTRMSWVRNCAAFMIAQKMYCCVAGHVSSLWDMLMAAALIILILIMVASIRDSFAKEDAHEKNWTGWRNWRMFCMGFLAIDVMWLFFVAALEPWLHAAGQIAMLLMFWIAACIEAPPKKRREPEISGRTAESLS